jgi:aminoglycoside 3-N-acetyltransferase
LIVYNTMFFNSPIKYNKSNLIEDFEHAGIKKGDCLLLHSSLSKIGWVNGGAVTVITALLDVLGSEGTLVVPTHSGDNSDPSGWKNPPLPEEWWEKFREEMPAYDARTTPTFLMGVIPELLRTWPGAMRSDHPQTSFAAVGPLAEKITAGHALDCQLGERSPLARLEEVGAKVMLLGVTFNSCTAFHLADYRHSPRLEKNRFVATVDGSRQWMNVSDITFDDSDFGDIGCQVIKTGSFKEISVGATHCWTFSIADAISTATTWMEANRNDLA